ncbi:MAG: DEAD/DEAH box helicase [Cellulosilyticaceae bacterium]
MQKAITDMGFEQATPIQGKAIMPMIEGKDIIAQAPTGTGKTCAFGIPAIERVDTKNPHVQVLILCPTRELAIQISEEMSNLSKYKEGVRILPIYGGQSIDRQMASLRKKPQIIIGTPGRVMDHMRRGTLKLDHLQLLVLDEADEMLNMGFREDIDTILESVPEKRQFVLFSATLPKAIMDIANKYQHDVQKISVIHNKVMTVPTIEQFYLEVRDTHKVEVLSRIMDAHNFKLSVVFCNTKKRVDDLCKALQERGYAAEALHGDMKQMHRDSVMSKFRSGLVDILIATDVAARGIDVDDVEAVFNYDVPTDEEYYVHRIGRTGRAGRKGVSYTFAIGRELHKLKEIERYTKSKVKHMKPPTIEVIRENKLSSVLDEVKELLHEGKYSKYTQAIETMVDEINDSTEEITVSSLDIAAAFLQVAMDKLVMGSSEEMNLEEMMKNDRGQGRDRGDRGGRSDRGDRGGERTYNDQGYVRLFINLGKKDKLKEANLVKIIASETSITGKQIGKIDMLDKFSFVEVPEKFLKEMMLKLPQQKVRGRQINIEVANKKKKK